MTDIVIKATARFQDTGELVKQRPIIQVERADGKLPNTVRASMDSGRDNPFRPDGKIYRSADPIVDFYKNGANQSRTQSPADSQLLLNGNQQDSDPKGKQKKRNKRQSKSNKHTDLQTGESTSCWRWWCCCCCRWCSSCFRRSKCCGRKTDADQNADENDITSANCANTNQPTTKQPTKIVVLREEEEEEAEEAKKMEDKEADRPTNTNCKQTKSKGRCSVS